MSNCPIPFDRSYWVVPGKLMAGCYPGSPDPSEATRKLTGLMESGIRHVINLMETDETGHNGEPFVPYENTLCNLAVSHKTSVTFDRFSIQDLGTPLGINMNRILNQIDLNIRDNKPVYVHCWGGRGRTGTVVGCWMVRHGLASGVEAICKISYLRRKNSDSEHPSPETLPQVKMVETWG